MIAAISIYRLPPLARVTTPPSPVNVPGPPPVAEIVIAPLPTVRSCCARLVILT